MSNINEKIDAYVKCARRKTALTTSLILIVTLPVILWFVMPNMGATSLVTGVVVRLVGLPSDEGDKIYLQVKLDHGGAVVHVRVRQRAIFQQGEKVSMEKQKSLIFGRPVYRLH